MSCLRLFIVLLTLLSSGFVHASLSFGDAPRASDEELDRMRGGFIVSFNGQEFLMPFSITGIERLTQIGGQTYINGELLSPRVNPQALSPMQASQIGVNVQAPVTVSVASSGSGGAMSGISASPANGSSPNASSISPSNSPVGASMAADAGAGAAAGSPSSPVSVGAAAASSGAADASTVVSTPGTQVATNGPLIVIQSGTANTVMLPANVSLDSLATFIQNSVNNQVIRNITTMNITIQSQMLAAQARLSAILNQNLNGLR